MKVICFSGNVDCENYVYEKEFEIDEENFDNARCPECGGKVAPAWLKEFELPSEKKLKTELVELYEKRRNLEERINNLKEDRLADHHEKRRNLEESLINLKEGK